MAFKLKAFKYNLAMAKSGAQDYLDNLPTKGLMQALCEDTIDEAKVQTQLNLLSVDDAKKYKTALTYLFKEIKSVYYIGMKTYTTAYQGNEQAEYRPNRSSGGNWLGDSVVYTTKSFHATAVIYAHVPVNKKFDIGFSQTCTAKTYSAAYQNDNLSLRLINSNPYPCSDNLQLPFYWLSGAHNCTHPTGMKDKALGCAEYTFELDDNFIDNGFPYLISYSKNGMNQTTLCTGISRSQRFSAYFCYRPAGNGRLTVMAQSDWGLDPSVTVNLNNSTASYSASPVNITDSQPSPRTQLPSAATGAGFNESQYLYAGNNQLGPY